MGTGRKWGRMKAPKNFMKFPYNLFKKATIENEKINKKGEYVIELKVKDTWLMTLLKKILKEHKE